MTKHVLGDVEFIVVQLSDDHLSPRVLVALLRHVESGSLRLLDFLVARRVSAHEYRLIEVDVDDFALAGLDLGTPGLVSEDDVGFLLSELPIGALAALVLVEPTWPEQMSRDLAPFGDRVLATRVIPAEVANLVLDAARRQG